MTIGEIHMLAEIFGSVFLAISAAIIIFELHQNLKQRQIQNTFMRAIEVEKMFYKRMEKDTAILICKGKESYHELEYFEKHQFDAYVQLIVSMFSRADIMAAETSYLMGKKSTQLRMRRNAKTLFSSPGMRASYLALKESGALDGYDNFHKVINELKIMPEK